MVNVSDSIEGGQGSILARRAGSIKAGFNRDPYILEDAFVSVISFGPEGMTTVPLTELRSLESCRCDCARPLWSACRIQCTSGGAVGRDANPHQTHT
jgi:hypothetical protein